MKLRIFTFRFAPEQGGFDDGALVEFLDTREALSVQEHFFVHELVPTLVLVVSYRDIPRPGERDRAREAASDARAELDGPAQAVFDALRRWRNERARRSARPAYMLFTNRQMAELARRCPKSLGELEAIEGLGKAKREEFGEELVSFLLETSAKLSATEPKPLGAASDP